MTGDQVAPSELEKAAREHCDFLFRSKAAGGLPRKQAEALIIIAFTIGAAWGLDRPDMIELAKSQFAAMGARHQ